MIVTYVEGGLGNMLFQICFTLALAKRNKAEYYFTNVNPNYFKIRREHNSSVEDYGATIFRNVKNLNDQNRFKPLPIIAHHCPYEYFEAQYEPECINFYKGYFQSELFFNDQESYIKEILKPDEKITKQIIELYPFLLTDYCVSIHVRRGDYLGLPHHHPAATKEYYDAAVKQFDDADKILIFTDDPNWCASSFSDPRMVVMAEKDWISLYIMSFCKGHIIANSSFSWWGARFAEFYNSNPIKVIAPIKWFGPAITHDLTNLVPSRWDRI